VAARLQASRSTKPGLGLLNLDVVDPRDWGVKWDGATDDTAAWTTFFAALGTTPAIILGAAGTSICGPNVIQLDTKQVLIGAYGSTVLKLRSGTGTDTRLVSTKNIASLAGTMSNAGPYQFGLIGVRLEGNSAGVTTRAIGLIPAAPTFAGTTGTLAAGTYNYKVTAKTAFGETPASPWSSFTLGATGGITVSWATVSGATGYNVYGRSWSQNGSGFAFIGTSATTSFTDNGSVTAAVEMLGHHDGTAGSLVHFYGYNYTIRDVDCYDAPGMGFLLEWGDQVNGPAVGIDMESRLDNLRATDCFSNGFAFYGPHDSSARNLLVANCAKTNTANIDAWVLGNGPLNVDQVHTWGQCRYSQSIYGQGFIKSANAEGAMTAQLFVYNGEVDWDGLVFFPGNATARGVVVGDAQYSPSATRITAKARQFGQVLGGYTSNGAAFDLTYLGNNSIFTGYSDQIAGTCIVEPLASGNSDVQIVNAFDKATSPRYTDQPYTFGTAWTGSTKPASPPAGAFTMFARNVAGRILPAIVGPSGLDTSLQPLLGRNRVLWVAPIAGTTTLSSWGISLTVTGTVTLANPATTNLHTSIARIDYLVGTAATTAVAGWRSSVQALWRGNAAGLGGFTYICRWSPATGQATTTSRAFCGVSSANTAPTDVEPSSQVNCLGMGWDAADTNMQFMGNDATGSATKTDLGASFPVPTTDRPGVYEIALFCPPNGSNVQWQVTNVGTGATASGTITVAGDMPANTTFLGPRAYCSVGGTSSVIGITLFSLYIESDT
jgi:hypothetical protein